VEMWTTQRLPFEPKGVLRTARDHLRTVLRKLTAARQSIVEARYTSISTGFVDTENVLLYNVGPAAFGSATRYGLIFTREFADPPTAPNDEGCWRHYHRYTLIPSNTTRIGPPSELEFRFELATLNPSLKPHDYWWAAKQGLSAVKSRYADISGAYEIRRTLSGVHQMEPGGRTLLDRPPPLNGMPVSELVDRRRHLCALARLAAAHHATITP
jgi:hypothetical protein